MQRFGNPVTSPWRAGSVDASLIAAPRQRNTEDEKEAIKDGRIPDNWKDKPAKLRQKDRDARWTVKYTKAKPREDGSTPPVGSWRFRSSAIETTSRSIAVSASFANGARRTPPPMRAAVCAMDFSTRPTRRAASWADTAYRSAVNEEFMERNGFVGHVHRKRPKGRPMPEAIRRANNAKSKIRSRA